MTALDALARDAMATRLFHPPLTLEKLGNRLNRVKIVNATTGLDTGARIFKDAEGWGIARWSHPVTMIDEGCTQARTDGSNRYPTRLNAVKAIVTRFGLHRRTEPLVRRVGGTEVKDVHSWQEAVTLLGKRNRRKLANNTYLETDGYRDDDGKLHGDIHVMFHKTAIITYYENGGYRLNTGVWRTKTTQERMNRFLPAWITVAGEWESNGGWGGYRDASNWLAYIRLGYEKDKVGQSNCIRPYFHRTIEIGPRGGYITDLPSKVF